MVYESKFKSEAIDEEIEITVAQTHPTTVGVWMLSESTSNVLKGDLAYYDVAADQLRTQVYTAENGGGVLPKMAKANSRPFSISATLTVLVTLAPGMTTWVR